MDKNKNMSKDMKDIAIAQYKFKKQYEFKKRVINSASIAAMLIGYILLLAVYSFCFTAIKIQGNAMSPTIKDKDYIISSKLAYVKQEPERGDIILSNDKIYRIIGMPNETIAINGGYIYINGQQVTEPYLKQALTYSPQINFTTGSNSYFVLNENRNITSDSRTGLIITKDNIQGKIICILMN